jgi:hypothetical protein
MSASAGSRGKKPSTGEHSSHLVDHEVRIVMDIGCSESEEPKSRVEEPVLASVVLGKAVPMDSSVVLDSKAMIRVIEIRAPDKSTLAVMERYLSLRAG